MYHNVNLEDNRDNKKAYPMGRFDGYARKPPGSLVMQEAPGGAVLFCRLGFFFLAYSSRSLRFRAKAAAKAATGRAMIQTSTPVSPVAGALLPPV